MKKYIFCLLILLSLLPIAHALTASIGNARMIIRTEVEEGETTVIEKYVRVNNVNDIPVDVNLEPHGDLIDIVELLDTSFTLEPGESKDANFVIRLNYGGTYQGKIAVSFSAEDSPGVGLGSTVIIIAEGPEDPNRKQQTEEEITEEEITEEPQQETEEEEVIEEEPKEEVEEEKEVTIGLGNTPKEETQKKKASPLVGIIIILIIVGVGAIIALVLMLVLKKK